MTNFSAHDGEHNHEDRSGGLLATLRRRPVLSAILILLIDVLVSALLTQVLKKYVPASFQSDFFTVIALALIAAIILTTLRWWRLVGFNAPAEWRHPLLLIVPLLAVVALPLVRGVQALSLDTSLYLIAGYVLTAFHEEVVFRGMVLGVLAPSGRTRAIWLGALLFGLAHSANLLVRSNPFLVLAQMVGAASSAVGLGALRFRTNTIWFVLGIHFFEDLLLHYTRLPAIPVNVAASVILFCVGLYILWTYRRESMSPGGRAVSRP